jgi:uncharacterized protein YciI
MKRGFCPHKLRLAWEKHPAQIARMSPRLVLALFALCLVCAPLRAAEKKAPPAALDPDLTTYYVCLLTKGTFAGIGVQEERVKTQAAQDAYISQLAAAGKLLVAGPFADKSEWRGLYIFKCASFTEAQSLALGDPEVRASRLKFEIHPWITAKGSIHDPEFPMSK